MYVYIYEELTTPHPQHTNNVCKDKKATLLALQLLSRFIWPNCIYFVPLVFKALS